MECQAIFRGSSWRAESSQRPGSERTNHPVADATRLAFQKQSSSLQLSMVCQRYLHLFIRQPKNTGRRLAIRQSNCSNRPATTPILIAVIDAHTAHPRGRRQAADGTCIGVDATEALATYCFSLFHASHPGSLSAKARFFGRICRYSERTRNRLPRPTMATLLFTKRRGAK